MARTYIRTKSKTYTPQDLALAIEKVTNGELTQYSAAQKYKIPMTTLYEHVKKHNHTLRPNAGVPLQKIHLRNSTENLTQYFNPRIVGGSDAPEGSVPYMVALVVGERLVHLVCGGAMVSPNLVLTAAHCIDIYVMFDVLIPSYHGVVGTNRWNNGGYNVYFKGFHMHPQWSWSTLEYDIGLLPLDRDLTWSSTVSMIGINWERIERDEPCFVSGWGAWSADSDVDVRPIQYDPAQLQRLNISTISDERCNAAFLPLELSINPEIQICTLHSVGHGMCMGDSGSPLISKTSNSIIGLVNWGIACARGYPDVFARLSGFRDFVVGTQELYR